MESLINVITVLLSITFAILFFITKAKYYNIHDINIKLIKDKEEISKAMNESHKKAILLQNIISSRMYAVKGTNACKIFSTTNKTKNSVSMRIDKSVILEDNTEKKTKEYVSAVLCYRYDTGDIVYYIPIDYINSLISSYFVDITYETMIKHIKRKALHQVDYSKK